MEWFEGYVYIIYIYIYVRTYKYERLPVNVINMDGIKGILMKQMRIIVLFLFRTELFPTVRAPRYVT